MTATLSTEDVERALEQMEGEGLAARAPAAEPEADDEVVVADGQAAEPDPYPGFVVDSDDKAAWVVGLMLGLDDEAERIARQAEAMLADVARERARLDHRFGDELRTYARGRLKGKSRTFRTMQGDCAFVTNPGGLRLSDPASALVWATKHLPEAIRHPPAPPPSVIADELKAYVVVTGVAVPGISLVPDVETFTVKPAPPPRAPRSKKGKG